MTKKYKFGFEPWGAALFIVIMLPGIVWTFVPAVNDILRAESVTKELDGVGSMFRALSAAAVCFVKNRDAQKRGLSPFISAVIGCCLLYYGSWAAYYGGIASAAVILGLTVPPCTAFLFFAIDRKNYAAVVPIAAFTVCHTVYGVVNFIV
ncbi:MAG: hypothetical protein NC078_04460 [Ruminococcus sp.]|nr:hypothetical protein [Ruminococcus sp.]